jgi:squalene synthase HpnC
VAPYLEPSFRKDAKYENFPVGSWLLSGNLRPHVKCFYDFARHADDIADNPELSPGEKIKRLNRFEEALLGNGNGEFAVQKAKDMYESLKKSGVSPQHCVDLLCAFKQDAVKSRYNDWADLIAYCSLSAAPVGRFMIDLHGEPNKNYEGSDSLCSALQLINHLQDCGDDYRTLGRVYLPMELVSEANLDLIDLSCNKTSPALRRVIDWTLGGINSQLKDAEMLLTSLHSMRLSLEASIIYQIAKKLGQKLGENDPLSKRIELSKIDIASCSVKGFTTGLIYRC